MFEGSKSHKFHVALVSAAFCVLEAIWHNAASHTVGIGWCGLVTQVIPQGRRTGGTNLPELAL